MGKATTTPTRIASDVSGTAAAVAADEHRSVAEQVNHWARIGMQVERAGTVATRRVREAAAGERQFSTLDADERVIAHALADAEIADRVAAAEFGVQARGDGQTTVSLDDDGRLVEIGADGTRRHL